MEVWALCIHGRSSTILWRTALLLIVGLTTLELQSGCYSSQAQRVGICSTRPQATVAAESGSSSSNSKSDSQSSSTDLADSSRQGIQLTSGQEEQASGLPSDTSKTDELWQNSETRSSESQPSTPTLPVGHQISLAELEFWALQSNPTLAQAQAIPNVTLQSVIEYDKATQSTTASTLVALPLPIYNRNQENIDKAAADVRTDQNEVRRVQLVQLVLRELLSDSFRRY